MTIQQLKKHIRAEADRSEKMSDTLGIDNEYLQNYYQGKFLAYSSTLELLEMIEEEE